MNKKLIKCYKTPSIIEKSMLEYIRHFMTIFWKEHIMNKKLILFMTTLSLAAAPISVFASENDVPVATIEALEERAGLKAATGAYRTWKQYNAAWAGIHLGSSPYTMNDSGCLVTAIATLMVHSGAADEAGVDPGKLCTYLNNNGGFTSAGELYWTKVNGAVDGFSLSQYRVMLSGSKSDKLAQIRSYLNQGYYIIVSVGYGAHWVAVDGMNSDGSNVNIFDPAYSFSNLFSDGSGGGYSADGIDRVALFRSTGSGNGNIDNGSTEVESYNATGKVNISAAYLNVRSGVGTSYSILTDSSGKKVSLNNGETVTITGKGKDSTGAVWYRISINGLTGYVHGAYVLITNESQTPESGKAAIVTGSYVNIRSGAGTAYSIVGGAPKDAEITVYEEKTDSSGNKWYKVKYGSTVGYMMAEYIQVKKDNNNETTYDAKAGKVNGSNVRVRSDAGTSYSIVKTLALNTSVKVIGEKKDSNGDLWYKVTFDGGEGYIFGEFVTITNESANQPGNTPSYEPKNGKVKEDYVNVRTGAGTNYSAVISLRINTAVTIVGEAKDSSGATWYKIKYANGEGYMRSDFITITDGSDSNNNNGGYTKKTGKVNANSVNVRSGAGTTNGIVGNLSSGTAVTIVGEAKDSSGKVWYKIEYTNGSGYMISDYITVDGSSDNNNGSTGTYEKKAGKVNADSVRVRSGAGTNNSIVGTLSSGTAVTVVGEAKDSNGAKWYKIEYSGGSGYMHSDYITITNESGGSSGSGSTPTYESKTGKVNDGPVNVRTGPGTGYSIVISLKEDTAVTVVGEAKDSGGATWYKIKYAGGEGYMRSDFITINSSSGGSNSGGSGSSGGSTNQDYPMEGVSGKEGIVNATEVYVRKSASQNGEVLTTIKKDVSVLIQSATKDSDGIIWYEVEFAGISGYMMAQYITVQ